MSVTEKHDAGGSDILCLFLRSQSGVIADPLRPPLPPKWGFHMPPIYANGHISATGDPIHFMFGSRVGFSGTSDLMALFSIRTNSRWPPSGIISNGHISATAHDLLIWRASRGHVCDSTAFL